MMLSSGKHARPDDSPFMGEGCPTMFRRNNEGGMDVVTPPTRCEPESMIDRSYVNCVAPDTVVSDATIENCARYITERMVSALNSRAAFSNPEDPLASSQSENPLISSPQILFGKIQHFFRFVNRFSSLETGEAIQCVWLIDKLITLDHEPANMCMVPVVQEGNIGTVLLCAMMLSMKMGRDVPYSNKWWALAFTVPVDILTQSEAVFFQRLGYRLHISESAYLNLHTLLARG